MNLHIQGEMNIEVDGQPIHLAANGDQILLTLTQLTTLAIAARVLSNLPRTIGTKNALSQLTAVCPSIIINVGQDTVLQIKRRDGFFSFLWRHQFSFENKKLWLRNSYHFLRYYLK